MYHDRAIELIMHAAAACMIPFTEDDAHALVRRMHPYTIPAGAWFLVEDERSDSDFTMLVLSGDVVVESEIADGSSLTIGVLSPGRWVGELSMLDGQRRVWLPAGRPMTPMWCAPSSAARNFSTCSTPSRTWRPN